MLTKRNNVNKKLLTQILAKGNLSFISEILVKSPWWRYFQWRYFHRCKMNICNRELFSLTKLTQLDFFLSTSSAIRFVPTHYLKLCSLSCISPQLEKSAYMKEISERKIAQQITSLTAVVVKTTCASNEFPEKVTQIPSMRKLPCSPISSLLWPSCFHTSSLMMY